MHLSLIKKYTKVTAYPAICYIIVLNTGCVVNTAKSEISMKNLVSEYTEVVSLNPVVLSKQKAASEKDESTAIKINNEMIDFDKKPNDSVLTTEKNNEQTLLSDQSLFADINLFNDSNPISDNPFDGVLWPLKKIEISSYYGNRGGRLHAGLDLRAPKGTPIYAVLNGQIVLSKYKKIYGNVVIISHEGNLQTVYAHLNKSFSKAGDFVKAGDLIGQVGRTGRATGYHLHFETRIAGIPKDPLKYLNTQNIELSMFEHIVNKIKYEIASL